MRSYLITIALLIVANAGAQSTPEISPEGFAYGVDLQVESGPPLQTLSIPESVYRGVTRADLADLRIFNQQGQVVPLVVCPPAAETLAVRRSMSFPVFQVREIRGRSTIGSDAGSAIDVQTAAGEQLTIRLPTGAKESEEDALSVGAWIIDTGDPAGRLISLTPDWQTVIGESEVTVRILGSDDLQRWRVLVDTATLLHAESEGDLTGGSPRNRLRSSRIELPESDVRYLRLERRDGAGALRIGAVEAEVELKQSPADAVWLETEAISDKEPLPAGSFRFNSEQLAPISGARIELPLENLWLELGLDSRAEPGFPWQERWRGAVNSIAELQQRNTDVPIRFAARADPEWRVRVLGGQESLVGKPLALRLAYRPHQLRFLAQGEAPFMLAWGSAAGDIHSLACKSLLGDLPQTERAQLTGTARLNGDIRVLGGSSALQPEPQPLPWKQWMLWAILLLGSVILLVMALRLLGQIRTDDIS